MLQADLADASGLGRIDEVLRTDQSITIYDATSAKKRPAHPPLYKIPLGALNVR